MKTADSTIEEIRSLVAIAQIFLEEKEQSIVSILTELGNKTIGNKFGMRLSQLGMPPKGQIPRSTNGKQEPAVKPVENKPDLIPVPAAPSNPIVNQMVRVVCCENIEDKSIPKLKSLGPGFLARVLEKQDERVRVQITDVGFDSYILWLPADDVELVNQQ